MSKTLDILAPVLAGNGGAAATPGLGVLSDVPIQSLPRCSHSHQGLDFSMAKSSSQPKIP